MEIVTFKEDMQQQVDNFFRKCFAAVGIPYSPKDRHIDIADIDRHYMKNGCFWCLIDNDNIIGTIAVRILDGANGVVELKRMFVLPEYQGNGYGRELLEYAVAYVQEQHYKKVCLDMILSILVYTFFTRMFDLMLPFVAKHSIAVV